MRDYELVAIFPPEDSEEVGSARVERITALVGEHGGTVPEVHRWGVRKLAYPVKKLREGFYVLFKLKLAPERVSALETTLRLDREIVRYLLVHDEGGVGPAARTGARVG